MYQEKAWCDQEIMKEWISTEWENSFKNPIGQNSDGKILTADVHDVHRAQQTDSVKEFLKKRQNFPSQCTTRMYISCPSCRRIDK